MAVLIEFSSGLGNQLFQFAAGYSLAQSTESKMIGDATAYAYTVKSGCRGTWRRFALEELGFPLQIRSSGIAALYRIRGYPRLCRYVRSLGFKHYQCQGGHRPDFNKLRGNIRLSGYFQDIRYIGRHQTAVLDVIRNCLELKCGTSYHRLPENYGAIHVRMGDFLQFPEFYPNYFRDRAIKLTKMLLDQTEIDKVMVYSDDPLQTSRLLGRFGGRVEFAVPEARFNGASDILSMASARVLAICNSTFSWWAGMLLSQRGGLVIAPDRWARSMDANLVNLYPKSWQIWATE